MPVEIKELIIRATTTAEPREETPATPPERLSEADRHAIVQECVKQVLRILQKEKER